MRTEALLVALAVASWIVVACTGSDPQVRVASTPDASTSAVDDAATLPADGPLSDEEYRALVLSQHPTVYWRMTSLAGAGIVADEQGASVLQLQPGALTITPDDAFGPSVHFDGDAGCALAQNPAILRFGAGQSFTFEAWAKLDQPDTTTFRIVGGSYTAAAEGPAGYLIDYNSTARQVAAQLFFHGAAMTTQDDAGHDASAWSLYTMVVDGGQILLYVDGKVVPSPASGQTVDVTGTTVFALGRDPRKLDHFWLGNIAEVALFSRALSAGEIASHMRRRH